MFDIYMGGCDIVLGFKLLHSLGPILMDFKDLRMQFQNEGQQYKFQGITTGSPEIIISHRMENILKKGHSGIIAQLHSIHVVETHFRDPDLQSMLSHQQVVFTTPNKIPPSRGVHDHSIPPILGILPPNVRPYLHPFSQNNEIEKIVHELLEASVIHPITIPYYYSVVMVLKKEGTFHMCPDFHTLNKFTIKGKFPILVIDELLDKLSVSQYFTKLDLHYG
jgi:hypothetical protein